MRLMIRRIGGILTPTFGRTRCSHCYVPWGNGSRSPRFVDYAYTRTAARGAFCLCLWCWPRTTPEQRLEYAEQAFADREYWPQIEAAYRSDR
jgi:hypothetical protein